MLFGLPWFAIIPIVAIIGGLVYAYKEQELKMEEKKMGSSRELNDMRKVIHNLKSRVENLEAIVSEERRQSPQASQEYTSREQKPPRQSSQNLENSLRDIEIEDEVEGQNGDNSGAGRNRARG